MVTFSVGCVWAVVRGDECRGGGRLVACKQALCVKVACVTQDRRVAAVLTEKTAGTEPQRLKPNKKNLKKNESKLNDHCEKQTV